MGDDSTFTPQGERRWNELGARAQALYANNVWCGHCRGSITIIGFTGSMEGEDLILRGKCAKCGGAVARVIEGG